MPVFARNAVATSQPLAAAAGFEALRKGGNAMDAALCMAIALTVVEPTSNGIGSDAFAIVWDGSQLHGLNASGRSPQGWDTSGFGGGVPQRGWSPVTVPGAVDAWVQCSRKFGRMPFAELFDAAIEYAEGGYPVSPVTAMVWARAAEPLKEFEAWRETFLFDGKPPEVGQSIKLPHHARTLQQIADSEGEAFYRGEIAKKIEEDAKRHGAAMTQTDLAAHTSDWVGTISTPFHGVDLHEIPPNGQGLAALVALGVLRHTPLLEYSVDTADSVHLQIEAMKAGFAEAFAHIGERPDVPPDELLDDGYLAKHASHIDPRKAGRPATMMPVSSGTVYLCAADDEGMMVSFIQSNFNGFGSGIVIPGTGIAMQNRGHGFVTTPGHPNQAAPGKRPFHTIIPGFVTGGARMAFGVMGGYMQAQGHVQMVSRIFGYGQNPQAASDAPRWQVALDGTLLLEEGFSGDVAQELARRGHRIVENQPAGLFGGAQLILKTDDAYCAASDHRKDGCALGF
ncbi:MAG: gamma-glutamyltransferase family protein [Fimbriimonadaceae bacterium]